MGSFPPFPGDLIPLAFSEKQLTSPLEICSLSIYMLWLDESEQNGNIKHHSLTNDTVTLLFSVDVLFPKQGL